MKFRREWEWFLLLLVRMNDGLRCRIALDACEGVI